MIVVAWWVALAGLWPIADPGHENFGSLLVRVDLMLHVVGVWVLLHHYFFSS